MAEEANMKKAIEEIKNADEESLRNIIEQWFETTRTDGMRLGAQYISAGVFAVIKKHLKKNSKPSLRDYQRCTDEILHIISVQLTQQNDSEEQNNVVQEEDEI
jgi:predicted unusual protein kinase regulating ubiquinone biosynthesis (AarF/ABC1/UbiB family)